MPCCSGMASLKSALGAASLAPATFESFHGPSSEETPPPCSLSTECSPHCISIAPPHLCASTRRAERISPPDRLEGFVWGSLRPTHGLRALLASKASLQHTVGHVTFHIRCTLQFPPGDRGGFTGTAKVAANTDADLRQCRAQLSCMACEQLRSCHRCCRTRPGCCCAWGRSGGRSSS